MERSDARKSREEREAAARADLHARRLATRIARFEAQMARRLIVACPPSHEHDLGGCYDCDCPLTPASSEYDAHRAALKSADQ